MFECQHPILEITSFHLHFFPACFTKTGRLCVFPFKHRNYTTSGVAQNVTYRACASSDIYEPWCATALDDHGFPLEWGYCLPDCPHETPKIVCQVIYLGNGDGEEHTLSYICNL